MGEDSLAKLREGRGHGIAIEPENAGAVRLFLALATQWHSVARSNGKIELLVRTRLDYAAVPGICTALGIVFDEKLLDGLRLLESETLRLDADRNAKIFGRR